MSVLPLIDVAIALPVYKTYTYAVPDALLPLISTGKRVLVPFRSRRVTGYVLGKSRAQGNFKPKPVIDILDDQPLFPESMVAFFHWIADYYLYPVGEVIKSALPAGLTVYDCSLISSSAKGRETLSKKSATDTRLDVLKALESGPMTAKRISKKIKKDLSAVLINKMANAGLIKRKQVLKQSRARAKTHKFLSVINTDIPKDRFYEKRKQVIDLILKKKALARRDLVSCLPNSEGYLNYLEKNKYLSSCMKTVFRDPLGECIMPDTPPRLTEEQEVAVSAVAAALGKGFTAFLLEGVTGSGKTEVYMRIAEKALAKGFSIIVLVPEISLISQTERRFRARFGDRIAVLHSRLSAGEKYDQWLAIRKNNVKIVIGARSAIFAPLANPGIIIVDEEHDTSYKQESGLRYNARDIAIVRARQSGFLALLGSATPSVQSIHNAHQMKYKRLELKNRINKKPLPKVRFVDLSEQMEKRGIRRFITPVLHQAMKEALDRKEQVLLFLNRRGYASFPVCASCGEPVKCKNCAITLTFHKRINAFKCHLCGFTKAAVSECANCGLRTIKTLGIGTEQIEAGVKKLFPDARVARLDRDTTTRKGALVEILKNLRHRNIDILVGTQMVAKGHDFPHITLVGIICADLSLSFPDFRACEHTFQLLAQVSGRAGRGDQKGQVIMQTYNPSHFSIAAAREHDCNGFFLKEKSFRKELGYPPFSRLAQLKISGSNKMETKKYALATGRLCQNILIEKQAFVKSIEVLGPIESPLSKIAGRFRWQILLKSRDSGNLHSFIRHLMFENNSFVFKNRQVRIAVDIDPVFMM